MDKIKLYACTRKGVKTITKLTQAPCIIAAGPGAWKELPRLRRKAKIAGVNPYTIDAVDIIEEELGSLSLEEIVEARAARFRASNLHMMMPKVDASTRATRRELLSKPHRVILNWSYQPIIVNPRTCRLTPCGSLRERCPRDVKPVECPSWSLAGPGLTLNSFRAYLSRIPKGPGILTIVEYRMLPRLIDKLPSDRPLYILPIEEPWEIHPRLVMETLLHDLNPILLVSHSLQLEEIRASLSATVDVGSECTLCGACASICPARALILEEDSEEAKLLHDPYLCIACGACVSACPEKTLRLRKGVTAWKGAKVVASASIVKCPKCTTPLAPKPLIAKVEARLSSRRVKIDSSILYLCPTCKADVINKHYRSSL